MHRSLVYRRTHVDRSQASASEDKLKFTRLFQENVPIIDFQRPERRLEVMEVLERMEEYGPHWGPTRVDLLNLRTLLPGPPEVESLTGTKTELVKIYKKILQIDYSAGTNMDTTISNENNGDSAPETSQITDIHLLNSHWWKIWWRTENNKNYWNGWRH